MNQLWFELSYTSGWLPDEKYNDGIHFKTIGEELVGEITQCNWDTLDEAVITMVNDSYYTVDFTTGYMEGNSYSTITITTKDEKGSVTFKAAGPMSGTYPLPGVDAQMKVIPRSIKGVGSLAFITPKQIIANFYWTDTGYGTGTITGHYKDIDKNKNN